MSIVTTTLLTAVIGQSKSIDSYVQTGLKDASFTASVGKSSQRELKKINKDFAQSYRFKSTSVKLKEPFKLRMTATVDEMDILFIVNGPERLVKIPRAGINRRENLAKSPGKRQTAFDFGIITPSLFKNYFQAKFVRMDRATQNAVFDVTYVSSLKDKTRHRIWIDPSKKVVTKREWYNQNGGFLMATFLYEKPKKFGTIWMPTELTVKNADNKFAGTTYYKGIKVNTGLAETFFATR